MDYWAVPSRSVRAPGLRASSLLVLVALAVTAAGYAAPRVARADGEIAVALAEPDDSQFPDVTVVVTADRDGRPFASLSAENVTVTEGGQPARVMSVRRAQDSGMSLSVVLTIDTSGSMEGATIAAAKSAANALAQRLSPADAAAVVAFSDRVDVRQPVTRDRGAVQRAIGALSAAGNTALYDAVAESARVAADSGSARRAIVLLSDGREFGGASQITRDQSLQRAAQSGAVVYAVGVGPDIDRAFLTEIASRSGGRFFEASGAAEVPQIYAALEDLLRGQFVITARSAAPSTGETRQIRVELRDAIGQGSAQRQYSSKRDVLGVPPPVATAVLEPSTRAEPPESSSNMNMSVGVIAGGAGIAVLMVLAGAWRTRRVRGRPNGPALGVTVPAREGDVLPQAGGTLEILSGLAQGARFDLEAAPATIGTAPECWVRLPVGDGVAPLHARLWWRDGKPMLHHIASGYQTRVNGQPIVWASLDPETEIMLGSVAIRFTPAGEAVADVEVVMSALGNGPEALRPGA